MAMLNNHRVFVAILTKHLFQMIKGEERSMLIGPSNVHGIAPCGTQLLTVPRNLTWTNDLWAFGFMADIYNIYIYLCRYRMIYIYSCYGCRCIMMHSIYPRCSMYGIFTYIYPKNDPNVGNISIHGAYGYSYQWFIYQLITQGGTTLWISQIPL